MKMTIFVVNNSAYAMKNVRFTMLRVSKDTCSSGLFTTRLKEYAKWSNEMNGIYQGHVILDYEKCIQLKALCSLMEMFRAQ